MEPPGKILSLYLTKKIEVCGILHQEYLKMRVKKVNIFKDIKLETFPLIQLKLSFSIYKNLIFHLCPNVALYLKNSFVWKD